jgi:pimeloyl-ACP methyl ester carboxylesterase
MLKPIFIGAAAVVAALATFVLAASSASASKTGYAPVNGLKIYYEIHGEGEPLILLHGGLGSTEMFSDILPALSPHRQVVAIDLQGHGRTADVERPLTSEAMADDVAGVMKYLKIDRANIMGYSLGGGVAVRVAIQHPNVVNKLVLVSTAFRSDNWYPEILSAMSQMGPQTAEALKQTPLYQVYARVAPKPADWPVLHTKLREMSQRQYDWSKDVAAIHTPTLLVFGDADAIPTSRAVAFFELLGGGKRDGGWDGSGMSNARLAILPGLTHYTIFSSPALVAVVSPFLDADAESKVKPVQGKSTTPR